MKLFFYPYKKGSKSVKALKDALGAKSIKLEGSRFRPSPRKLVVNWGSSVCPYPCFNPPDNVKRASDKLQAFQILSEGVDMPPFSTSRQEASKWLLEGKTVVCRTVLNGHSGEGIVLAENEEQLVDAPLYVQYIPKKEEYRVHVFQGEVLFVQRKARRLEEENPNWKIRNHKNGFIYANRDIQLPDETKEMACRAVAYLGLDFGAVDIIWNERQNKYFVLEVNTAPGLTGSTLEAYVNKFKEVLNNE